MGKSRHNTGMMTDEPKPTSEIPPDDDTPEIEPLAVDESSPVDSDPETEALIESPAEDEPELPAIHDDSPMVDLPSLDVEGLDIDGALAAVASLGDLVMEPDMAEEEETETVAAEDFDEGPSDGEIEADVEPEVEAVPQPLSALSTPPLLTLQRGQLASVIPALLLMGIGTWLTFVYTTTETTPSPGLIGGVALTAVCVSLIAQWLSSGRWARGAFLVGASLALAGGVFAYLIQPGGLELVRGWPLIIVALGVGYILTAIFSRITESRQVFWGIVIGAGGLAALLVTMGGLDSALLNVIGSLWPVVVVILLVVWGLPLLFRGRG